MSTFTERMNSATTRFITEHTNDDPLQLMLTAHRYPEVDMQWAVRQIAARQRIRYKLPEFYSHTEIQYPQQLSLEQCSSEQTARHKAGLVTGQTLVDLTGGFGIDFYYMAKERVESYYVEPQAELCEIAEFNFKLLDLKGFTISNSSAENYLRLMKNVDCIYLDPHRRDTSGRKTVLISDCEPDLRQLLPELFEKSKKILIKLSPMLDLQRALIDLPYTQQIDIIAVENECKELLFLLDKSTSRENVKIRCFNYHKNKPVQQFDLKGLDDTVPVSYASYPLEYIYEPNVSVLKSGAYNRIAKQFDLLKFHPNTHLYTSSHYFNEFPGRVFKLTEYRVSSKETFSYLNITYKSANISVRNFPLSSDELRKKTKLKDGGEWSIFAFKNIENQNIITISRKI